MFELLIAAAVLNPAQLYFLIDAPLTVTVNAARVTEAGDAPPTKLLLLSPEGKIEAEAAVEAGVETIDLGKMLPGVRDGKTHYVQPVTAAGIGVGPALVVVPLWPGDPHARREIAAKLGGKPMGLRVYVERLVVFETTAGSITMALSPEVAPNTTMSFMMLVGGGFYDGTVFHRVARGFVIQGGDPTGTGFGGPGYMLDLEPSEKKHLKGTLSMARSANPDSAGSQFFICLNALPQLDPAAGSRGYTTFGDVVGGMDVVEKIGALRTHGEMEDGRPIDTPKITDARLEPAPPRTIVRD